MQGKTVFINENNEYEATPTYLFDQADLYRTAPRDAGLTWFTESRYGLGVGYGLHSLIGGGHDALKKTGIPLASYENLKDNFTAEHFDAVDLVQFAIANGMRYVDFTVRGPDGFCLYNTASGDFSCANSPARRDLLGELASVCEYEGIGLCLTYSLGTDWRHPHSPGSLAPADDLSLEKYLEFVSAQLTELLTQYGPVAAVSFTEIEMAAAVGADKIDCANLYRMIRMLQPQTLVSFQQGLSGDEDFFTANGKLPEKTAPADVQGFIHSQNEKPVQIRESLAPGYWSYTPDMAGKHLKGTDIWNRLGNAGASHLNMLVHTSLLPDGSLDLEDINTLLEVGKKVEKKGFPCS